MCRHKPIHLGFHQHLDQVSVAQFTPGLPELDGCIYDIFGDVSLLRLWFTFQVEGFGWAGCNAQNTANATVQVHGCFAIVQPDGFHLAAGFAGAAAIADFYIQHSMKWA